MYYVINKTSAKTIKILVGSNAIKNKIKNKQTRSYIMKSGFK